MNRAAAFLFSLFILVATSPADSTEGQGPTRAEIEATMGLPSEGDRVRGQMDTIGFVVEEAPAEDVVSSAVRLEYESLAAQDQELGMTDGQGFIGGICPHDDHLYASRVDVHLTERITAPRVLLIGVFHRAKMWELQDRMVFDQFEAWHGPWSDIKIDPMREELVAALRPEAFVVNNAMHCREHSLEAIIPFLQRGHPDRTILPILVPHMGWDRVTELTDELADAIVTIMQENGWRLGTDIAVVVSSDAVHYGPDFNHAPFGTDTEAYDRAVARDLQLVDENLSGPLESAKLHRLLEKLVDPETLEYRLPWCGRFSIPFGLELLRKVSIATEGETPYGSLLRSGTSLSEPELPVTSASRESGLGYTAPSNLHHWVGYAAVGYRLE
jgi:AmmeMemoRadiSam system protein B